MGAGAEPGIQNIVKAIKDMNLRASLFIGTPYGAVSVFDTANLR